MAKLPHFEWRVLTANCEASEHSRSLETLLNASEAEGWQLFQLLPVANSGDTRLVLRREPPKPAAG